MRYIGITLFLMAFSSLAVFADEPDIIFIMPFDNAIVNTESTMVMYDTEPGFIPKIEHMGFELPAPLIVGGNENDLHHLTLKLKEGKNTLIWTNPATEKRLGEMTIYYVPSYSMKRVPRSKGKEFKFHSRDMEARCNLCHSIPQEMETVRDNPMSPVGKVCSACHSDIDTAAKPHEPAGTYDCFSCHQPSYDPARFALVNSQMALCATCHSQTTDSLLGQKFVHGPVASGECLICHDPHGGKRKNLLRSSTLDMCMRCHFDTVPQEVKNSLHGDLECDDCHQPHGGGNPNFLIEEGANLCLSECHDLPDEELGGHPIPGHPRQAAVDPSKPGRQMWCLSCHKIHGEEDISQLDIFNDTEIQRTFCMRCHY